MLKKEITYEDFNGDKITETLYFNLTKPELLELEVSYKDGIEGALKKLLADDDRAGLLAFFKMTVLLAYGQKSDDGKRFIKSEELTKDFTQTNAYADIYMELLSNSDAAAAFINGIVPADLAEKMKEETVKAKTAEILGTKEVETTPPAA